MKPMPLFVSLALLGVSLLEGCATAGPNQSGNPLVESTMQIDSETSEFAGSPAADDSDVDFKLWSSLWESLPYYSDGDPLAAIQHYGRQMAWTDLDQAREWDFYDNSSEGPYYVVVPKYKHSTITVEIILNHNGKFIPTTEVFQKENAPDNYALVISNPFSEGAESLRLTVTSENQTAYFDFFYAAAIDSFPFTDNGIVHIHPISNTARNDDSMQTGESDVFGPTNEFGGGTSQWIKELDPDIFEQTNEFGAVESRNAASSKTLYTKYATEDDLPAATREEQRLIDTYLSPYSASGLYQTNFTPDYMDEMSAFTLTILFDSLCDQFGGYPLETEILPGGRVTGDVFEGKLMKHLPLTEQMIRSICTSYNPADGTYELSPGIGSAPAYYVITEYVELDTALRISYAHYGLAVDETYTPATNEIQTGESIKLFGTGVAVIDRTDEAYAILGNLYKEV